jgi:predicted phosphodiesterase
MQLAIISDLHANLPAVRAVLTDMRRGAVAEAVCLGDLVGYNAFCRETIVAVRQAAIRSVHGNHDLMAVDRLTDLTCGPVARRAIAWTREALDDEGRAYLAELPGALRLPDDVLCVHAVLGDPVTRLTTPAQFCEQARRLQAETPPVRLCFVGHTHRQHVVQVTPAGEVVTHTGESVTLGPTGFWFVNPGSVGDMLARDQRAAYAVYDSETRQVRFHRVVYDRSSVLRENARHGLGPGPIGRVAAALLGGRLASVVWEARRP